MLLFVVVVVVVVVVVALVAAVSAVAASAVAASAVVPVAAAILAVAVTAAVVNLHLLYGCFFFVSTTVVVDNPVGNNSCFTMVMTNWFSAQQQNRNYRMMMISMLSLSFLLLLSFCRC